MLPPPHEMGGSMAMSEPGDEDDGRGSRRLGLGIMRIEMFRAGRSRSAMGRPVGAPIIATAPSAASTRISQYDLVSPPRDRERERERYAGRGGAATPTPAPGTGGGLRARSGSVSNGSSKTQPEQIADQWRASNMYRSQTPGASGMYRSQTPGASGIYRSQTPGAASSRRMQFVVRNGDGIERPATTEPVRPDMTMPRSPRVSGGPRLPRQIVPPVPLGNVVTVNSLHHIDVNPQIYDYPYPPRSPPGPSPEQQQRKSSTDSDSSRISNNSNSSGSTRTRSPIDWLRSRFQNARTVTGTTVPNIDVEPPVCASLL
ncbi:hypothetical protein BDQ17DRAFT_819029 [Cyathus striatus]|nr:hypothetical protein BDQ17DRAFT_819029 [Cyathus striatus]